LIKFASRVARGGRATTTVHPSQDQHNSVLTCEDAEPRPTQRKVQTMALDQPG